MVFKEIDQNPFKLAERTLPIDFTMPISNKYIFDITIPEGYEVEEMPKPVTYSLPNSDGGYTYQIEKTNTGVRVLIRFGIKKIFFAPNEYTSLREVFNLIIAKQEEKIVLRRK